MQQTPQSNTILREIIPHAGHLPFEGRSKEEIKHAISAGIMRPFPAAMSPACVSFVSAMMLRDTAQRPGAKQLLQHPIVLTYLRTLVPTQPIAMMHPLASTSDSASSLNGTAAMPRPLFASKRPGQGELLPLLRVISCQLHGLSNCSTYLTVFQVETACQSRDWPCTAQLTQLRALPGVSCSRLVSAVDSRD